MLMVLVASRKLLCIKPSFTMILVCNQLLRPTQPEYQRGGGSVVVLCSLEGNHSSGITLGMCQTLWHVHWWVQWKWDEHHVYTMARFTFTLYPDIEYAFYFREWGIVYLSQFLTYFFIISTRSAEMFWVNFHENLEHAGPWDSKQLIVFWGDADPVQMLVHE